MANKTTKNNTKFNDNKRCYVCGNKMERKSIPYENTKWGGGSKITEKATADVCTCGVMIFSAYEVERLQELSRSYD